MLVYQRVMIMGYDDFQYSPLLSMMSQIMIYLFFMGYNGIY